MWRTSRKVNRLLLQQDFVRRWYDDYGMDDIAYDMYQCQLCWQKGIVRPEEHFAFFHEEVYAMLVMSL